MRAYLAAFPHIAKSGPLFRAQLPEQQDGIQLQGQTWIAFYRENRTFPNGTVKRILRGKTVGMIGPRKRTGPKPNATITIAADLQRRGRSWPVIFRAVSHGVEMSPAQRHALQAAVYYRLDDSKRKLLAPSKQIATYDAAREEARKLVASLRDRSPRKLAHALDPNSAMDARSIRRILRELGTQAGVGKVTPHMLRHYLRAIQELLGHENISTTQIYTHCLASHLREMLEKAHPSWQEERDGKK